MMQMYYDDVPKNLHSDTLTVLADKYDGDFSKFAAEYYENSIFTNQERFMEKLPSLKPSEVEADRGYQLLQSFVAAYRTKIIPQSQPAELMLRRSMRLFVEGLRKMNSDVVYAPNANSTQRLTYGSVGSYQAKDAVYYGFFSTLDGVIAKEDPNNDEFIVPAKLKTLHSNKDYGRYAEDGSVPVCFISNNDITGGNSGSPVIDARGQLIGCAFDGNWEAMSGDIAFEDKLQRTICVDIRYILFIVDKYAGATHLIDEMTLVEGKKRKKKNRSRSIMVE